MTGARPTEPRVPIVEEMAARMREGSALGGLVRPVHLTAMLAHNRTVSKAVNTFASTFFDPELLDPRLRELLILRMGWDTESAYEFGQHVLAARQVGISEDEIRATTRPVADGPWSPLESVALQAVDEVHADDCVADSTWAELSALVDDATAISIVGVAACYRMVAGILNSLGVQPEPDLPGWP